eukprot:gnl/Chilomastix_caulleri/809.p1 GENE.gnl/Chilomastix_caulleri/809~~gnl/Chilomastix_caulleri/809.p1  ORF type:complete len:112 (+),score=22.51 gnl/Chilomastix_caulleri/809:47-337(+)
MPFCEITTSFTFKSDADKDVFAKAISKEVSRLARKPEAYVMVAVKDGVTMCMAGSTSNPIAFIRYSSIGGISPANNKAVSEYINRCYYHSLWCSTM